jgi:glycosyltransferase involved in cell wall biosynthesis
MTSLSIAMPFASADARRQRLFEWVCRRWTFLLPDAQLCIGESDLANFNRSAARNAAIAQATGDVLVITDADTACNVEQVQAAIEMVRGGAAWVVAHTTYYALSEAFSDKVLGGPVDIEFAPPYEGPSSTRSEAGVLVLPRATLDRVGGYDERFIGWGYEDNAFAAAVNQVAGPYHRVAGDMLHLWHDPGLAMAQPNIAHNRALFRELTE